MSSDEESAHLNFLEMFKISHIVSEDSIYSKSTVFNKTSILAFDPANPKLFFIVTPKFCLHLEYFQKLIGPTTIFMGNPRTGFYFLKPSKKMIKVKFRIYRNEDPTDHEIQRCKRCNNKDIFVNRRLRYENFAQERRVTRATMARIRSRGSDTRDLSSYMSHVRIVIKDPPPTSSREKISYDTDCQYYADDELSSDNSSASDEFDSDIDEKDIPFDFMYQDFLKAKLRRYVRLGRLLLEIRKWSLFSE